MDSLNTSSTAPELKFCVNCKHIGTNSNGDWTKYKCFAPQNFSHINLVTGHKEYLFQTCDVLRLMTGDTDTCGAAGDWYEVKPATQPYSVEVLTPAQLTAKVQGAKMVKIRTNPGTDLLQELGL